MTTIDRDTAKAFQKRMVGVMNDAALGMLLGIGDELGLLDVLARSGPSDTATLAAAAGVDERYLREWLDGIVAGAVATYDAATGHYALPAEHAACLTPADGPVNLARSLKMLTMLAGVEPDLRERFRHGGGLGYDHYPRFHALMAEDAAATHDAGLLDVVVPTVPGLHERLTAGAALADIGCGSGHAVNLLARAYPASTFVGYDLGDEAIEAARAEAADWGLSNARFEVRDVAELGEEAAYDVVTAFDAIHDQAFPDRVLAGIATSLRPGGTFLMVDIKAESGVEHNLALPWASYLYTISLMHCMTVSLAHGGAGLGTVWGRQTAVRMLEEAGLVDVDVREVRTDPFNYFYVARKP
ncbi:class I SAM-dependent methyltransferase [Nocardioides albidus]|uniref:Class I SAM-dependent methyltransferase n=1 Tax=Nocardioides albidus TaxID=1517589 RepID=A0A5C4VK14_9ACTN|nr:methyltransferase domain-containing protein [Nocardioides albidus]TNM36202.1 class I SAM-dependent methyltransferase [Nocardioides albidus]